MWNATGINLVNRLNLGILLHNVSSTSCAAMLETNGYVRAITVSGALGGLVCTRTMVPPAWVFDGDDSGRIATFSHLRVPDSGGHAVRYEGKHGNDSYWEFVDDVQPDADYQKTADPADDCDKEALCVGSLAVGGGYEYGVSFTGNLGAMLCNNFTLAPAPVDGDGPGNKGSGALMGLKNVDISAESSLGIHQVIDGEPLTLVVGKNRTIVWPGLLNGSNWRDYEGKSDDYDAERHHCSSDCASCPTVWSGDCLGEMTSDLTLDELLERPPFSDRAENQKAARNSWHRLPPDVMPPTFKIYPIPQYETLPVPEARIIGRLTSLPWRYNPGFSGPPAMVEPVKELCQLLTAIAAADITWAGQRGVGAAFGGSKAATGTGALLGIRNGRILAHGPAARIIAAGGAKEVTGAIFAGATAGGIAGAVVAPIISDLAVRTACGLIVGTVEVKYDPESEAGRAIEAWGRTVAGDRVSTKEWAKVWKDFVGMFPGIRQLIGFTTGKTTLGINRDHPLIRAIDYYTSKPQWDWSV
ncbi:hypothetical protein CP532_6681 [Ophiocordyceps camponoti-leonardi (nom. inval.)]|nr:hypothetical protein CP532_6681 [Ophiocordyceps camponoti-leonardi (nom. inval.)]